jgi:hypothetical protein
MNLLRYLKRATIKTGAVIFLLAYFNTGNTMETSNPSTPVTKSSMSTMTTMSRMIQACQLFLKDENTKDFDTGLCLGIIIGVEDNASYDKKICIPTETVMRQKVETVLTFIQNNPSLMNASFASNVYDALSPQWPCATK